MGLETYNGTSCTNTDLDFYQFVDGFSQPTCKNLHYTIIFNAFMFMQVFNEINARKFEEYNVFKGFFNNYIFLTILIFTTGFQYFIVSYGGVMMRCVPLTLKQHLFCVIIGAISIIWHVIFKMAVPSSLFHRFHVNEKEMSEEESAHSLNAILRKSFHESF